MKKRILGRYDGRKRSWFRQFKEFLVILLAVVLLFQLVVGVFYVKGDSMYPTLHNGELALYVRIVPCYERGDIAAVRLPSGEKYVKRIVAVEGDVVDFADGRLLINGETQEEPYAYGFTAPVGTTIRYPYTVAPGHYFVLGDNRENSMDSRVFGAVLKSELKGKLILHMGVTWRD